MLWPRKCKSRLKEMAHRRALFTALAAGAAGAMALWPTNAGLALPPPEDTPEELLRTRIITKARSPIDGKPMSAAAYAQLQEQLQDANRTGAVDSDFAQLILLLQVRRVVRPILPLFP